ncbi:small ribosomal subunit Rsm22 family protein [Phenylobacterium aquaticum]|uniref:small ribosomal subunit Rsm22 family protein n=1 Tax=Phenylobacterium aquaticum TaxID=1763816 RepID=UPI0026F36CAB|nr:small ribosomal subunit Rsm22 family protein [Phenylobacterium aquaticum]
MTPNLPAPLRLAADRLMEGVARAGVAERADKISQAYRAGRSSAAVIKDAEDAQAYVLARLPATYAACARAFDEAARIAPDFRPLSLLDAGAGPGGAGWAALETWSSLDRAVLLDSNRAFLAMAGTLAEGGPEALALAERRVADLAQPKDWPVADLVVASYALAEIAPAAQAATVAGLWAVCAGLLVLVEPGTPDGYARILAARDLLIAQGAQILAPCPHAQACPLVAPDWCHFVQRLPRSRDHKLAKGADAPFEDEKFIYLAAAQPHVAALARTARVIAPARTLKPAITLKLCTPEGAMEHRDFPRRDKPTYASVRRLDWGDTLES